MIKVYNKTKSLGCIAMWLKRYWILCLLFISHFVYAGEFGNYCLLSLSEGHFLKTDCSVNSLYKGKEYEFTVLYNARNIRRKSVSDLVLAWKIFADSLPEDKAKKCALVLHTQIRDENTPV